MRDLELGEGGEGYIGPDDWCYYCGKCGHLGDVSMAAASLITTTYDFLGL